MPSGVLPYVGLSSSFLSSFVIPAFGVAGASSATLAPALLSFEAIPALGVAGTSDAGSEPAESDEATMRFRSSLSAMSLNLPAGLPPLRMVVELLQGSSGGSWSTRGGRETLSGGANDGQRSLAWPPSSSAALESGC